MVLAFFFTPAPFYPSGYHLSNCSNVEWAVFESSGSDWGKKEWDIDENWKIYYAQ